MRTDEWSPFGIGGRYVAALTLAPAQIEAQQKELGEVTLLTAVSNMAFSAGWVAEQLKYFEQEGVLSSVSTR